MKKFILILFFILLTPILYAADVQIYQNGILLGTMTKEQFGVLIEGADKYKQIMDAQNNNRVSVIADEVKPDTKVKNQYACNFKIVWIDTQGKELNYILSNLTFNIEQGNVIEGSRVRTWYRVVAEIGFPTSVGIIVFLLLIL